MSRWLDGLRARWDAWHQRRRDEAWRRRNGLPKDYFTASVAAGDRGVARQAVAALDVLRDLYAQDARIDQLDRALAPFDLCVLDHDPERKVIRIGRPAPPPPPPPVTD